MNPTHDWHIDTDGMELLIRRDEEDSVGVHLGHENIDDAHATVIITSRLLEMIDSVHPGAVRAYLAASAQVVERAAMLLALTDEYDGCFERMGTDEEVSTDAEDCEFWRRRAQALAAAGLLRGGS